MKRLFLDDWRIPRDCAAYMWQRKADCREYHEGWEIARSFGQFAKCIDSMGVPDLVSLDYDLADVEELKASLDIEEWFSLDLNRAYNGADCLSYLIDRCRKDGKPLPEIYIHSANPDGCEEMKKMISEF
jgi:hypothetical protein